MDYTQQGLAFKIKKAVRYVRLYGVQRTLIKINGQYHMRRVYEKLPPITPQREKHRHVGIIGCGNFDYSHIAYYLKKKYGEVIRGAMDININRAASLYE